MSYTLPAIYSQAELGATKRVVLDAESVIGRANSDRLMIQRIDAITTRPLPRLGRRRAAVARLDYIAHILKETP